ncbi:glycosyltransferase family 61 protein [Salinicola sp. NYA28a]
MNSDSKISIFEEKKLVVFADRFALFSLDKGLIKKSEYLAKNQVEKNFLNGAINNSCYYEGAYIVAGNASKNNYYHWVSQVFASILFVLEHSEDYGKEKPINILGPQLNRFSREYIEILDGVNYIELKKGSLCLVEKAFFTNLLWNDLVFSKSKLKASLFDSLANKVELTKETRKKRIYVSRKDTSKRCVKNEKQVLEALERYGFEEVVLDGKSVRDQIQLFKSSEAVVAPHGAGLTNLLFCDKGTLVIELLQENYLNTCFYAIAESKELYYKALVNPVIVNGEDKHRDDIVVDIGLLADQLSESLSYQGLKA